MFSLSNLAKYRKGLVGLAALLSQLVALGLLHGPIQGIVTAVIAGLAAAGIVAVPNAPKT